MRPLTPTDWQSESLSTPLTSEATPEAAVALLVQAVQWPEAVALAPYCGCAHVFDGLTATALEQRYLAAVIAPGANHARLAIGTSWVVGGSAAPSAAYHSTYTDSSGAAAADEIKTLLASENFGFGQSPAFAANSQITLSSDKKDDTPASASNTGRLVELTQQGAPYVEAFNVTIASSVSLAVAMQVADLEAL